MGRSDIHLNPIYRKKFPKTSPIALLGFTKKPDFINGDIDLYDIELNNFEINADWKLTRKYKSIICTRCLYFCKSPLIFFEKCKDYLLEDGEIFVDFGLGHHWSKFKNFKVGWVKNGEHEWEYYENNYLWNTIWDDIFLENNQVQIFKKRIERFGYSDLSKAVYEEVPIVINLSELKTIFNVIQIDFLSLWEDIPQLYIFLNLKMLC